MEIIGTCIPAHALKARENAQRLRFFRFHARTDPPSFAPDVEAHTWTSKSQKAGKLNSQKRCVTSSFSAPAGRSRGVARISPKYIENINSRYGRARAPPLSLYLLPLIPLLIVYSCSPHIPSGNPRTQFIKRASQSKDGKRPSIPDRLDAILTF